MNFLDSKLVRIYRNTKTGELSNIKLNDDYEPTKYMYDSHTRIVFYKFEKNGVGYMCPYYSFGGEKTRVDIGDFDGGKFFA